MACAGHLINAGCCHCDRHRHHQGDPGPRSAKTSALASFCRLCPATPVAGGTGRLLCPTTSREGAEHTVLWQTLLGSHCPVLCLRGQVRMHQTHTQIGFVVRDDFMVPALRGASRERRSHPKRHPRGLTSPEQLDHDLGPSLAGPEPDLPEHTRLLVTL